MQYAVCANATLHECGESEVTSGIGSLLLLWDSLCFTSVYTRLAGLWAHGDPPVFTSHFAVGALGSHMCARLALHRSWEFELWSSHLLRRGFNTEPPPHLLPDPH